MSHISHIIVNQSPSRIKDMIGYNCKNQQIINLPFKCVRKPPEEMVSVPHFCFVSNPLLITSKNVDPFMWLHCYRDSGIIPHSAPKYLCPESNFLDQVHSPVCSSSKTIYDYFYFTLIGEKGIKYKGSKVFEKYLPYLFSMNLRGLVVAYNVSNISKVPNYKKCGVTVKVGRQPRKIVAKLMSECRFGFFPNLQDCSPRMIPECFLQNRPAVVNRKILGGWHYFDDQNFGALFGKTDDLRSAVQHIMSLPQNQKSLWDRRYGFNRYTRYLAELIQKHYPCDAAHDITHAYFKEFEPVFKNKPGEFTCE